MINIKEYTLIENEAGLAAFVRENEGIDWMGFDTEFIGEKRFYTLLCLIQIATERGNYLIDAIRIKNLQPFLDLIKNPDILKITHAGENDYRILQSQYNTIPQNTFDTQKGAGFVGYRYPLSFGKLLDKEINVRISKGYMVTDWKARPLKPKQIKYALNDVIYLRQLYDSLTKKLEKLNRVDWMRDEMLLWESMPYYADNPHREALESRLIQQIPFREQIFLIRMYQWRLEQAKRKNYSKEMILPRKVLGVIVQNMSSGKAALKDNRILNPRVIENNWTTFNQLYQATPTNEEEELLKTIPKKMVLSDSEELSSELLYIIMKKRCMDADVASEMLVSKNSLKQLRYKENYDDHSLLKGWRRKFLGDEFIQWLTYEGDLVMQIEEHQFVIEKKK